MSQNNYPYLGYFFNYFHFFFEILRMTSSIKDFEIINKIGEGAFSCVYKVFYLFLSLKVRRISDNKFYAMKKVKMSMLA